MSKFVSFVDVFTMLKANNKREMRRKKEVNQTSLMDGVYAVAYRSCVVVWSITDFSGVKLRWKVARTDLFVLAGSLLLKDIVKGE